MYQWKARKMEENSRLLSDAVFGFVLGDALGVPYEFKKRGTFRCTDMIGYGTHNQPPGTWSDDTAMLLATCRSLKENGLKVNIEDMKSRFLSWLNNGEYTAGGDVFDVGYSTSEALMSGIPQADEYSNGNGSLMRILPLTFVDCTDDQIRAVSGITHDHWISKEACVIYVHLLRKYINQIPEKQKSLAQIIRELPVMSKPFDRLHSLSSLSESDIRSTGYVVDTLEAALWCILQADQTGGDYKDCVLRAVNLGDDTDTVAAVTGGLAGLIYTLPADWICRLRNSDLIRYCLW